MFLSTSKMVFSLAISLIIQVIAVNCLYNYGRKPFTCGRYGFSCEDNGKLRLCDRKALYGPVFVCPPNTICNEDSSDVCDNSLNYLDPALKGILKCHPNERLADPTVPGCKGYILCVPIKKKFQAIKFKCTGNTIFNGITRTCSSPETYTCPLTNTSILNIEANRRVDVTGNDAVVENIPGAHRARPIDCKNYKFTIRQDGAHSRRVAYFCPKRPVQGHSVTRCTVFSNNFCLTLQRVDDDQFTVSSGIAHRKPRLMRFFSP